MKDLIYDLEMKLLDADFCKSADNLEEIFTADFREYGSSGNVYSRSETIEALLHQDGKRQIEIRDFAVDDMGAGVYLATYFSKDLQSSAQSLRTSIWVMRDSKLQMFFHQGTPISQEHAIE